MYGPAHIRNGSHGVSPLRTINEIVDLHKRGVITDAEFETLVRFMGAEHVENEVQLRLAEALEAVQERFLRILIGQTQHPNA